MVSAKSKKGLLSTGECSSQSDGWITPHWDDFLKEREITGKLTNKPCRNLEEVFYAGETPSAKSQGRNTPGMLEEEQGGWCICSRVRRERSSWRLSQRDKWSQKMRILLNHSENSWLSNQNELKDIGSVLVNYYCLMLHNKQFQIFNSLQEPTLFFTYDSVGQLWRLCFKLKIGFLMASTASAFWDGSYQSMLW